MMNNIEKKDCRGISYFRYIFAITGIRIDLPTYSNQNTNQ